MEEKEEPIKEEPIKEEPIKEEPIKEEQKKTKIKNRFRNSAQLFKSIHMNKWFWIVTIICCIILSYVRLDIYSTSNLIYGSITSVISLIIAMIVGWVVHYVSHNYDFTMLYEEISPSFIKNRFPRIHKYIKIVLRYTMDFHDHVHHDTSINKSPLNLSMEMFQNFLTQGFILVLISYFLNLGLQIKSTVYKLNHLVVLLWALFYTTIHNINYNLMKNEIHEEHHVNEYTNYGIDLVDILFNTKYDLENIESHNHGAINVSFITFVLFYLYKWVNREEILSKWHVTKWLSRVL